MFKQVPVCCDVSELPPVWFSYKIKVLNSSHEVIVEISIPELSVIAQKVINSNGKLTIDNVTIRSKDFNFGIDPRVATYSISYVKK